MEIQLPEYGLTTKEINVNVPVTRMQAISDRLTYVPLVRKVEQKRPAEAEKNSTECRFGYVAFLYPHREENASVGFLQIKTKKAQRAQYERKAVCKKLVGGSVHTVKRRYYYLEFHFTSDYQNYCSYIFYNNSRWISSHNRWERRK
jgi:hypothetical protein